MQGSMFPFHLLITKENSPRRVLLNKSGIEQEKKAKKRTCLHSVAAWSNTQPWPEFSFFQLFVSTFFLQFFWPSIDSSRKDDRALYFARRHRMETTIYKLNRQVWTYFMRHTLAAQGATAAVMCAHCWQAAAGTLISQPSCCLSGFLFLRPIRGKYFPSPRYLSVKCLIWGKQRYFFQTD